MAKGKKGFLGLLMEKGGDDSEEEDYDSDADAETMAAEDVLDAIKSKDASALSAALKHHYDVCSGASAEDSDDDLLEE